MYLNRGTLTFSWGELPRAHFPLTISPHLEKISFLDRTVHYGANYTCFGPTPNDHTTLMLQFHAKQNLLCIITAHEEAGKSSLIQL